MSISAKPPKIVYVRVERYEEDTEDGPDDGYLSVGYIPEALAPSPSEHEPVRTRTIGRYQLVGTLEVTSRIEVTEPKGV